MSVGQQLDIRIRQFFLCSFSSLPCGVVQSVKMIYLFDYRSFNARIFVLFLKLFSYLLQH